MRALGRRNQWGRRLLSASGAAASPGQQLPPSDRLAPNRLEDVFSLAPPVRSDQATWPQPDEDSQATAVAGPSQTSDESATGPSGGFTLAEVLEHAEAVPEVWDLEETEPEVSEVVEAVPEVWDLEETEPEVAELSPEFGETVPEVWELEASEHAASETVSETASEVVPEVVETVPEVLVPQVAAKPLPAPSGTGRHRSAAPAKSVSFRGLALTVRRAALLGALLLIVVLGALFALL